jgi:phosphohistidine phosphatase
MDSASCGYAQDDTRRMTAIFFVIFVSFVVKLSPPRECLREIKMELILWRHADAEPGFPDLARTLSARGREEAREAVQWLTEHLPPSCRILVSPAQRTQQTAEMLARPYETMAALAPEKSMGDLLAAIGWPKQKGVTLVVGHQPTLGEVAICLLGESRWMPKTASLCWLKAVEIPDKTPAMSRRVQATLTAVFTPSFIETRSLTA